MKINIKKILNKTGTGLFATSYYVIAIIIGMILAVSVLVFSGLKIYSNVTEQYSTTQIAWNNVTSDIYSDLRECKNQLSELYNMISVESEDYDTHRMQLDKVSKSIEELDNAMTYSEQYSLYTYIPIITKNVNTLTKNIDTNKETNFNYNGIMSNNKELLDIYNNSITETNNNLTTSFGKLIANIFDMHAWPQVVIKY